MGRLQVVIGMSSYTVLCLIILEVFLLSVFTHADARRQLVIFILFFYLVSHLSRLTGWQVQVRDPLISTPTSAVQEHTATDSFVIELRSSILHGKYFTL